MAFLLERRNDFVYLSTVQAEPCSRTEAELIERRDRQLCVESHLRELLEQGFEVAVVKDATAAPKHPQWGYGYTAALINYSFLAHAVFTTDQAVKLMEQG